MDAWYMDDSPEDQRLEHRLSPNQPASLEVLEKLGVFYSTLDADNYDTDPKLKAIRAERGYDYDDICEISRDKLPNYDAKIKTFYEEHIHEDEEIRYILAGSGYFDVRDENDRWIRIKVSKGDMLVLPEGIFHRFTLDTNNYIKAMRLFKGVPIWTPYNRPEADEHPSRAKYFQLIGSQAA